MTPYERIMARMDSGQTAGSEPGMEPTSDSPFDRIMAKLDTRPTSSGRFVRPIGSVPELGIRSVDPFGFQTGKVMQVTPDRTFRPSLEEGGGPIGWLAGQERKVRETLAPEGAPRRVTEPAFTDALVQTGQGAARLASGLVSTASGLERRAREGMADIADRGSLPRRIGSEQPLLEAPARSLRDTLDESFIEPTTPLGTGAMLAAPIAGEALKYAAVGGAVRGALGLAGKAPAAARTVGGALRAAAGDAAAIAPLDIATSFTPELTSAGAMGQLLSTPSGRRASESPLIPDAETLLAISQDPAKAAAFEAAFGILPDAALRSAGPALRAVGEGAGRIGSAIGRMFQRRAAAAASNEIRVPNENWTPPSVVTDRSGVKVPLEEPPLFEEVRPEFETPNQRRERLREDGVDVEDPPGTQLRPGVAIPEPKRDPLDRTRATLSREIPRAVKQTRRDLLERVRGTPTVEPEIPEPFRQPFDPIPMGRREGGSIVQYGDKTYWVPEPGLLDVTLPEPRPIEPEFQLPPIAASRGAPLERQMPAQTPLPESRRIPPWTGVPPERRMPGEQAPPSSPWPREAQAEAAGGVQRAPFDVRALPVRPARESVADLTAGYSNAARVAGDSWAPIGSLSGGTTADVTEAARVRELSEALRGPEAYLERLVVDDAGNVIEGVHRLEALRSLGATEVPVTRVQDMTRGLDLNAMRDAVKATGAYHPDQVEGIVRNVAEIVADEGGVEKALREIDQYDLGAHERAHRAALEVASPPTERRMPHAPPPLAGEAAASDELGRQPGETYKDYIARTRARRANEGAEIDTAFDALKLDDRGGFATPEVLRGLQGGAPGALVGSAVGAGLDDDGDRTTGAVTGALIGAGLGAAAGVRSVPDGPTKYDQLFASDPEYQAVLGTIGKGAEVPTDSRSIMERLRHSRFKASRDAAPWEDAEAIASGGSRTGVRDSMAAARGVDDQLKIFTEEVARPTFRQIAKVGESVMVLAKARHGLDLARHGKEATPEQIRTWQANVDRLGQIPEVAEAADALSAAYRRLWDMKLEVGLISPEVHASVLDRDKFYIPFLPEDIAEEAMPRVGGKYKPTSSGVRRMTEAVNEARTVNPLDQFLVDAGDTFRRVAHQRIANNIHTLVDAFPAEMKAQGFERMPERWVGSGDARHQTTRPERSQPGTITLLRDGEPVHYKVGNKDLADSWGLFTPGEMSIFVKGIQPVMEQNIGMLLKGVTSTGAVGSGIGALAADPGERRMGALKGAGYGLALAGGAGLLAAGGARGARTAMQAGVTGNPVFAVSNAIRDFAFSQLQHRMRTPELIATTGGAGIGGAVGAATAEPGWENRAEGFIKGASAGATPGALVHMGRHALLSASALNSILGPEVMGAVVGGMGGYLASGEEENGFARGLMGAAAGAGAGHLARTRWGAKADPARVREYMMKGAGSSGQYVRTLAEGKALRESLIKEGVSPADFLPWRGPWETVQFISRAVEMAPRFAKYNADRAAAIENLISSKGLNDEAANALRNADTETLEAAGLDFGPLVFNARDFTTDFGVKPGSSILRGATQVVPFMGAQIQGIDKFARTFNPFDKKGWQNTGMAAATIMAPTIALWTAIHSDPELAAEYDSRQDYEKNSYWLIPKKWFTGEPGFIRAPKPHDVGAAYASAPERFLDFGNKHVPGTLWPSLKQILGTTGPAGVPLAPAVIGPLVNATSGEHGVDRFRDRPINPEPWNDIPASLQYTDRNSTIAVEAGKDFGVSPAKIDYVARGVTGTLGGELLDMTSRMARAAGIDERPEPLGASRSFAGRFHTDPSATTQEEASLRLRFGAAQEAYNGVRELVDRRDVEGAKAFKDEHREQLLDYARLGPLMEATRKIAGYRADIRQNPELTPEQKVEMITRLNTSLARAITKFQTQQTPEPN